MKLRQWMPAALAMAIVSPTLVQASTDVDIDNDGLIEISTLEQLDLMRYDLAGTSLNGDSTGCPATGCNGYELVADLDFDTNGNGVADEGDLFWNDGAGWLPVGDTDGAAAYAQKKVTGAVTAKFNGNGFQVSNLYISRSDRSWVGLFANMYESEVNNLVLRGAEVTGGDATGVLTGGSNNTDIKNVRIVDSSVTGIDEVGMVAGRVFGDGDLLSTINVDGNVQGVRYSGGVVGWAKSDFSSSTESHINFENIIATADVANNYYTGCVIGVGLGAAVTSITSKCSITSSLNYNGGVAGALLSGSVNDVYIGSHITGMHDVGAVLGSASGVIIRNASVGSESSISARHPGGMFGQLRNSHVSDSYAFGAVMGTWSAAGLVHRVREEVTIENVFVANYLTVTGKTDPEFKAGLIREIYTPGIALSVNNAFWDVEATGTVLSLEGYGEGKTTSELTCPTLYPDASCDTSLFTLWSNDDWDFGTSSDYPVLR